MAGVRRNDIVRPTLIDRCFLLIPVLPVAVLVLVLSQVFVQLTGMTTWIAALVIGTTAAVIMRTAWRTWNCRFSVSPDMAENCWRFRTTVTPLASIRTCHPVKLLPGSRHSPTVLGLVVEGRTKPLGIPATFRFRRADREVVVRAITDLGIRVEGTSEYLDQR